MALQATVTLLGLIAGLAAAAAVLYVLVVMWWALGSGGAFSLLAKEPKPCPFDASTPLPGKQRHVEAGPTDLDLSIDIAAFQSQTRCQCDPEADALCESARDDQSAGVLQSPEDDFRGAPAAAAPSPPKPGPVFEALQKSMELHCDTVLDGMCSQAIDDQWEAVLKTLEGECRGSSAPDDDVRGECMEEVEEALSEQAADVWATEGCSMTMAGTFDAACEEYHQILMGELESMSQPVRCANLLELVVERVHMAGEFLLWVI